MWLRFLPPSIFIFVPSQRPTPATLPHPVYHSPISDAPFELFTRALHPYIPAAYFLSLVSIAHLCITLPWLLHVMRQFLKTVTNSFMILYFRWTLCNRAIPVVIRYVQVLGVHTNLKRTDKS